MDAKYGSSAKRDTAYVKWAMSRGRPRSQQCGKRGCAFRGTSRDELWNHLRDAHGIRR
jgi:hypothetical protein